MGQLATENMVKEKEKKRVEWAVEVCCQSNRQSVQYMSIKLVYIYL